MTTRAPAVLKSFNIRTCEHMIPGQLRMGARQAKNAPLYDHQNNQDDDQYDHHKPVIEKERLGSRLQFDPFSVSRPTQNEANRHRAL